MSMLALAFLLLVLPVPFLVRGARQDRKLVAASPGLVGATVLLLTCLAAHVARSPVPEAVPGLHAAVSAVPLVLLVPSVMALRVKWLSVLHGMTLCGVVGAWVIGGILIEGTS